MAKRAIDPAAEIASLRARIHSTELRFESLNARRTQLEDELASSLRQQEEALRAAHVEIDQRLADCEEAESRITALHGQCAEVDAQISLHKASTAGREAESSHARELDQVKAECGRLQAAIRQRKATRPGFL